MGEDWVNNMYVSFDVQGKDLMPVLNPNSWKIFIYFALFMICNVLIQNLFVGLAINNFRRIKDELCGYLLLTSL